MPPQDDVSSATRHISRYRDCLQSSGLGNYLGFFFMMLGIQNVVRYFPGFQYLAEAFRTFYGRSAYQNWLTTIVSFFDLIGHCRIFFPFGPVNYIREILPDHWLVCRNDNYFKPVDLPEFFLLCRRSSRHARYLVIHPYIILKSNRGERLIFLSDLDLLLSFYSLVKAIGITSPKHQAPGKFIYYYYFPILDNVVYVFFEKMMRFESLNDTMTKFRVLVLGK